jgi:hypothetical protein
MPKKKDGINKEINNFGQLSPIWAFFKKLRTEATMSKTLNFYFIRSGEIRIFLHMTFCSGTN